MGNTEESWQIGVLEEMSSSSCISSLLDLFHFEISSTDAVYG